MDLDVGAKLLGIGITRAYRLAKTTRQLVDGVPVIRVGSGWKVPIAPLEETLGIDLTATIDALMAADQPAPPGDDARTA